MMELDGLDGTGYGNAEVHIYEDEGMNINGYGSGVIDGSGNAYGYGSGVIDGSGNAYGYGSGYGIGESDGNYNGTGGAHNSYINHFIFPNRYQCKLKNRTAQQLVLIFIGYKI